MKALKNVNLYGTLTDIVIDGGKIISIGKCDIDGEDFGGNKIYPGLIDIHIHGCHGYDTMTGGLEEMADWQLAHGITTWYPTTMTMSLDDLKKATDVNLDFGHGANTPGFHLEGPFINVKYKGAMNADYIVPPSMEFFNQLKNIKLLTVAPETEGALEFIRECPAVVCIGHTECDYELAKAAIEAGAKCLTHTFNVMPPIHHRAPGPIGAGFDGGIYAQLITDGVHIHPSAVRMLVRIYGYDKVVLISDSIHATDVGDGDYIFGGQPITVKNGTARTLGGNLAGSTTCLFDCVRQAIKMGIPEEACVKMASENPAKLMGLNKGKIEVGYDADFIIVDKDFNLVRAIARGEMQTKTYEVRRRTDCIKKPGYKS